MAGQCRGNKGKMSISRGRSRLLQPGDLALESNRRRLQRQGSPPPVQPTPPIIQKTPPPVQTTPPPVPDPTRETFTFIPNPGHMPSRRFEQSSSHFTTHEPSSTVPVPQQSEDHQGDEEEEHREDEEEEHQEDEEHHQPERDADGKVIIRPFGRGRDTRGEWRDEASLVAGGRWGKSRGRCYGTGDLSTNLRHGVSQLTPEPQAPLSRNGKFESEVIEAFRQEAIAARAEAAEAKQRVTKAEQHAQQLENQLQTVVAEFQQRMTALERQSGGASCSVSQNRRTPRHPHYDDDLDDQSLDNASPDAHRF